MNLTLILFLLFRCVLRRPFLGAARSFLCVILASGQNHALSYYFCTHSVSTPGGGKVSPFVRSHFLQGRSSLDRCKKMTSLTNEDTSL